MDMLLKLAIAAGFVLVISFQHFMPAPTSYVDVPVKFHTVGR